MNENELVTRLDRIDEQADCIKQGCSSGYRIREVGTSSH